MRSRVYATVRRPFVCLSQHSPAAVAGLLLSASRAAIDISCPPGAQQQTHSSGVQRANACSATLT